MGFKLVTAPAAAVVSTADQKEFMRVTGATEDALIDTFVDAATKFVEGQINRKLIDQTWDYYLDAFPSRRNSEPWWNGVKQGHKQTILGQGDVVVLPFGPGSSITHLKTFDQDANESTFANTEYFLDDESDPPRLVLNDGSTWPSDLRTRHAIEIRAVYGYGATSASVPVDLILAVKIVANMMYETRGGCSDDKLLSDTVRSLILNHKIYVVSDVQV